MAVARGVQDPIDERLDELDQGVKRLRIEYDQYFLGILKRPPEVLTGKMQKIIVEFSNSPPHKSQQKFRFNSLNSKFQIYRQQWGRTLRQIEQGTYKGHLFKAHLHERERMQAQKQASKSDAPAETAPPARSAASGAIDQLYDALIAARTRAGEAGPAPERARVEAMVRKQTAALREKHPGAKVKFKVAIEGNRAKLIVSVSKG